MQRNLKSTNISMVTVKGISRVKKIIFAITLLSLSALQSEDAVVKKMVYESTTKGEAIQTLWNIHPKENQVVIKGIKKDKKIDIVYAPDFSLMEYTEKEGVDDSLFIEKVGPCLIVKSHQKGRDKILSHKIGEKPWVQEFTFGMQKFIGQKAKTFEFYIVYPKDLSMQEMVATKEIVEEIEILGKKHKTQRVKITLTGFKKQFWKAQAWFDVDTGLLVQYRANEGPRTPYTDIQILEGG